MKPRSLVLLVLLGSLVGLAATVMIARSRTRGTALAPLAASRLTRATASASPVPVPLNTAPAAPASGARTFVGVLLPPLMANLSSRADGKLLDVKVKVGQTVRKNEILATFDQRERLQELAVAEAQLKGALGAAAAAGADMGAARAKAARRNASVDIGGGRRIALVSGEEASQAVSDAHGAAGRAASAAGQVAEQKAKIGQLKIALEEATLRAPFDGIVTGTYFEAGINVHANETVVRVVGGGNALRVRMAVPEEDGAIARAGSSARLSLDDGRVMLARLQHVSPEVDSTTRSLFVEGDVDIRGDERQIALLAGRTVRAVVAQ
jgi:RND family efflux transporter MFP subunit